MSSTGVAAGRPDSHVLTNKTSSNLGAAATAVQPSATLLLNSQAAQQVIERRSLRQKRPRVPYDEDDSLEPGKTTRAKTSSSNAAAATAATRSSKTQKLQQQKRLRDPSGDMESLHPGKVTRVGQLAFAAAAASGGVRQAYPAGAVEHMELDLSGTDVHAEAVRLLSVVAPGASGLRVRKSYRVAQQKARQCEAVQANMAAPAAAEADEAAEVLLAIGRCCWVEKLVAVLRGELDGF